jgi:hypothetical protein
MPDFNIRSDSVNVEQIMEQIRSRIREKRGVDYTEQQIRELAAVKLEKFLDPRGVRSDLLAEFRRLQPAPAPFTVPLYAFEDSTLFESHRGIVRFFRALLKPLLKLFFNPNVLSHVLHAQAEINRQNVERVQHLEASMRQTGDLYYELLHNLVVELTRMSIDVKNMKMQVESLAGRLEFNERRARALESAVVYRPADETAERGRGERGGRHAPSQPRTEQPAAPRPESQPAQAATTPVSGETPAGGAPAEGPGQRSRRRRRRRGRRGGASAVSIMGGQSGAAQDASASEHAAEPGHESDAPVSSVEAVANGRTTGPADGRDTRPEPFEHAFGSSAHPAEHPAPGPRSTGDPSSDQ